MWYLMSYCFVTLLPYRHIALLSHRSIYSRSPVTRHPQGFCTLHGGVLEITRKCKEILILLSCEKNIFDTLSAFHKKCWGFNYWNYFFMIFMRFYWIAMFLNFIIRFSWTYSFSPTGWWFENINIFVTGNYFD